MQTIHDVLVANLTDKYITLETNVIINSGMSLYKDLIAAHRALNESLSDEATPD